MKPRTDSAPRRQPSPATLTPRAAPLALAALVPLALGAGAARADSAQPVFARVAPSVVTVIAHAEGGAFGGQGSGVVIDRGRVATNCHVVRDAGRLSVQHASGEHPARWIRADRSRDLCVLEVAGLEAPPARVRPRAGLAVGEPVYAVGNPLGFGLAVASGLISHFPTIDGEAFILGSAPQSPGSSGGGLFDGEGRLVGLTTSVFSAGQNLNLALPAEWIGELEHRGVAPTPPPPAPAPEPRWIEQAEALVAAARWSELERHARAWIAAQPGAARARLELGRALGGQGRWRDAEPALREALRLDDHHPRAWHLLAAGLHAHGRHAEAAQALARAGALEPGLADVPATRARWLLDDGQAAQALPEIERALAFDPFHHNHWYLLGIVRRQLGRADEAQQAFQAALGLNRQDEQARNALARLQAGGGRADDAHRTLAATTGTTEARTWVALGITDYNREHYAPAEDAFRKAVAAEPGFAEGWEKLGMTLVKTLRGEEALAAFGRALELDPALFEARLGRANLRGERGDLQGALADARALTERAPAEARAWRAHAFHSVAAQDARAAVASYRRLDALGQAETEDLAALADLLGKLGERSAAQAVFAKAEQGAPRHVGLLVNLAGFHGRNGDLEKSQEYLERALAVDPRNANAMSSKGYIQLLRGQPAAAVATLEQAALYDPKQANVWINLGHAHLRNRDVGRAIPALEKAIALAPQALDAHLYLAQSYLAARQGDKALAHAETVLARQPELPAALGVATLAHLMGGRNQAAAASFARLRSRDPQAAQRLRAQALAGGLGAAQALPQ